MSSLKPLLALFGLGLAMCGAKEHPKPSTVSPPAGPTSQPMSAQEEKKMPEARWVEIAAVSERFLIVKVADAGHRPQDAYEGMGLYAEALSRKDASQAVYYLLVPNSAKTAEFFQESGGRPAPLPKPRMINRMPGSALYTHFLADPARPGSLTVKLDGRQETVSLAPFASTLKALRFFWSGDPPSIAFEEVPGWMEGSGP